MAGEVELVALSKARQVKTIKSIVYHPETDKPDFNANNLALVEVTI